jgi:hypothetical protein
MYLRDAVTLLRQEIPKYSTKFSESSNISSIVHAAGVVTVITLTDHGLTTGDAATIVDAKQRTPISSITVANGIATAVTTIQHDLTLDYESSDDQPSITISGVTISAYNGTWTLSSVPSRTTFTFAITGSPAAASDGYLLEPSVDGFSGLKEVTKVNDTTFTFTTSKPLASEGQGGTVHNDFRITRSASIERFIEAYSKQLTNDWWGIVTPEPVIASKNRNILSDSTDMPTPGDEYRQKLISVFSLYLLIPSKSDIAGGGSYDEVISESAGIFKSLLGAALQSPYTIGSFSKIILESHQFHSFLKAYYIHQFNFSITDQIIIDDFNTTSDDVAFRDIDFDILNNFDETLMDNTLQLDN